MHSNAFVISQKTSSFVSFITMHRPNCVTDVQTEEGTRFVSTGTVITHLWGPLLTHALLYIPHLIQANIEKGAFSRDTANHQPLPVHGPLGGAHVVRGIQGRQSPC